MNTGDLAFSSAVIAALSEVGTAIDAILGGEICEFVCRAQ